MLSRFNPFSRLPNPKEVWAWGMYDLANQSFQLLINTLLFSLFFQTVVVGDQARGDSLWSRFAAINLIIVVILSPFAGALADAKAWKRKLLLGTGVLCAALTAALAFLQPGQVWLAAALYLPAAVACGLGENFLAAFLPEISTPRNVGYVSALGWTMSYIGALLLLGVTAAAVFGLHWTEADFRPLFGFAALWFFIGMLPTVLFLREKAVPLPDSGTSVVAQTFHRLVQSAKETRRFRQLVRFFVAFFVYSMSTMAVIYFLGLIGKNLGFQIRDLVLSALVIAGAAGLASGVTARFQDGFGHRRTISVFLVAWILSTLGLAATRLVHTPDWTFWVVSGLVGIALGGIGTSSRAIVGAFTPQDRAAEFFGLWGMVYKLAGVLGVISFGAVSTAFSTTERGQVAGLIMLAAFFAIGLALLWRVDERAGQAAAREAQPLTDQPSP